MRINVALLKEALASVPQLLRRKDSRQICDEPRFAEAVYRTAIAAELRDRLIFNDVLAVAP